MFVRGDRSRLKQVIVNLLDNAIRCTPRGGVVTLQSVAREGCNVLEVRDTGTGIPPEALGSLFAKFTQADASTTRRFGGSGLGLAICRELAQIMGGSIRVESHPQVGSTFVVSLPVKVAQESGPAPTLLPPHTVRSIHCLTLCESCSRAIPP